MKLLQYFTSNMSILMILMTIFSLSFLSKRINASGVFELEFIKLQPLIDVSTSTDNSTRSSPEQQQVAGQFVRQENPTNLVRTLVCLKEAFTSQLDGPCTFGNASITLNRDSLQQSNTNHHQEYSSNKQSSVQQRGSQLTNIVRILFTFRWTKSFTIILTTEQLQTDADNHPESPASQTSRGASQLVANRHGAVYDGSINNITDSSFPLNKSTGTVNKQQVIIDRHVLTENEVLPNLESNPNKPWASRFSRSLKSSLAYRFRVYCSLNYYGDGCTTFCRPRDDQFGHYNCSSTGQKVCIDGWHGPDCDKATCRSGCNQQHGYCEKPDTCQCRPGWTGSRCDECITYPGCQNGYCLSPWQCICQRNWGGVLCDQDLNFCGTHEPCRNNGTCQNIAPGRYKCNCQEGFTGVDCDIDLVKSNNAGALNKLSAGCALNPCLNGGTCFGFNNLLVDSGYVGPLLTDDESEVQNTTENHDAGEQLYRCQCVTGYTGDFCQWSDPPLLSVINILSNTTSERNSSPIISTTPDTAITKTSDSESIAIALKIFENTDKNTSVFTTFIENSHQTPHHVDLKHLISGVVIASVIGVFLASLLLAWCCLMALERSRFSFIQMNIIRSENCQNGFDQPIVYSTLKRVHNKIRDSFRRSSRNRIKPETKLSIENVLRPPKPPPPYEESNNYNLSKVRIEHPNFHQKIEHLNDKVSESITIAENLVIRGALEQKLASSSSATPSSIAADSNINIQIDNARLNCPRHGHLYRQRHMLEYMHNNEKSKLDDIDECATRPLSEHSTYFHHNSHHHNHN